MIQSKTTGWIFCLFMFVFMACRPDCRIEGKKGEMTVDKDCRIRLNVNHVKTEYLPRFVVLYNARDPRPAMRPAGIPNVLYNAVTWLSEHSDARPVARTADQTGDGFDDRILNASVDRRSFGLFHAGETVTVAPVGFVRESERVRFSYPDTDRFSLESILSFDSETGYPQLEFRLKPKVTGFFSVGYDGFQHYRPSELSEVWQPMIWQERRLPDREYMTLAFRCPVPSAFVTAGQKTEGIVAHPAEFPFQPLPTAENSRFGVALRRPDSTFTPMLFAPVLGGPGSAMQPGSEYTFRALLFTVPGRTAEALEKTAKEIYGFRDYRCNTTVNLNQTIENMIDYALSKYSRFIDKEKGCAYSTDVPGAVKNVSALNPLEIALLNDNENMYRQRAYPVIEYMLSREKFLFCADISQKIQYPSRRLNGPCAPVSELTTLYSVFSGKNPFLITLAEKEYRSSRVRNLDVLEKGENWKNAMHLYKATGERTYLKEACLGADRYIADRIEQKATDFTDPDAGGFFFWTGFAPKWIDLLELFELTHERKYLNAAYEGARQYLQYIWFCPAIPEVEIAVNQEGKAPHYAYLRQKGHPQMAAEPETVPAWRLSEIGLTPESSGTCTGHRGIFMANYAAWMVRIAAYTEDDFLAKVAKAAIIGRYAGFPGYHINTARTTVYEKADYALRPHRELSVNSFHYNHIMPHVSLLYDYLISDVLYKSKREIDFPPEFIEAYAYLQSNFYGHRAGQFYGEKAWLWMPVGLVKTSDVQLNYLAARGENRLFLAFSNQSQEEVESEITLDRVRLGMPENKSYILKIRVNNGKETTGELENGKFRVRVPANGLTAVTIEGIQVKTAVQEKLLGEGTIGWQKDFAESEEKEIRAMLLQWGKETRNVYVYFNVEDSDYLSVSVKCGKQVLSDSEYPYECTFTLPEGITRVDIQAEGVKRNGERKVWETLRLEK